MFIYGVVNASPDSLESESIVASESDALDRSRSLIADGADGIDGSDGSNGANGSDGKNSLTDTERSNNIEGCNPSGSYIYSGLDANGNGELDDDEISSVGYVCDGGYDCSSGNGNNGNGNGSEGCSPSDSGNGDE